MNFQNLIFVKRSSGHQCSCLTREVVKFAATVAIEYKPSFEDENKNLLLRCLKFLYDTTTGAGTSLLSCRKLRRTFRMPPLTSTMSWEVWGDE